MESYFDLRVCLLSFSWLKYWTSVLRRRYRRTRLTISALCIDSDSPYLKSTARQWFKYLSRAQLRLTDLFLIAMFHWFFMSLEVRPVITNAMSDHSFLLNYFMMKMIQFSSMVQLPFFKSGLSWLSHRSRHIFPVRSSILVAMTFHLRGPCLLMHSSNSSSHLRSHVFLFESMISILCE